jgi:hypothetical protein
MINPTPNIFTVTGDKGVAGIGGAMTPSVNLLIQGNQKQVCIRMVVCPLRLIHATVTQHFLHFKGG